ncbi:Prefoldin subunit-domain-containing protein [Neohortaea acidophila]|uniref:Prefoldin subunit-domain-containing protein n=1 Tax=Neohortaea acidophila TaxID=245834 RepID=A0A6A6PRV6_9PEZI|nr:Prefoldin subunit-domain-containing protein [Neohortaea acidophila]KAF2482411.1 Prefoldin subunit-domain-containing protein [Neohortaea acidophila]
MDLLRLEQQRQTLEDNLQKLRQSLKHWQIWEAEYEGLKEEIQTAGAEPSVSQLEELAKSYNGELVTEKEIREIVRLETGSDPRSAQQIIGLIERRQEYVQKNIDTVQRQFFDAEAKAEELAFAAANSTASEGTGLPLTEIHEELDEDGNVISSHLSQPEQTTADLVASLRKAGLKDGDFEGIASAAQPKTEDLKPAITNLSPLITSHPIHVEKRTNSDTPMSRTSSSGAEDLERPSSRKKSVSFTADTKPPEERPRTLSQEGRKSVSFAEKVAVMPAAPPPDSRSVSFSPNVEEIPPQPLGPPSPDVRPGNTQDASQTSGVASKAVVDVPNQNGTDEVAVDDAPVIPTTDSPEDARLRREMLEYHLNEVGNVVAQIDLDEGDMDMEDDEDDGSSFFTSSEYRDDDNDNNDEDTPYTTGHSESEESEDEFGRLKGGVITPEYREQMEALQRRLIGNLGPEPKDEEMASAASSAPDPKDVRRLVIRDKRHSTSSASSDNSEKKGAGKKRVSFADALDVAEAPGSPPLKAQKVLEGENVAPVASSVLERTTATSHSLPPNAMPASSIPKSARAAPIIDDSPTQAGSSALDDDDDDRPSGPPGKTIADTLTERTPSSRTAVAPGADEGDPILERRELATEYYRRRNDFIRQQGGFKATSDESEGLGELMEERPDGQVKKVSRFKAARIQPL